MTPLEELQAAHKRLSHLRTSSAPGPWLVNVAGFEEFDVEGEQPFNVGSTYARAEADLIVTLHRTIDAQLKVLERGIAREHVKWGADSPVLDLARAINGEAS